MESFEDFEHTTSVGRRFKFRPDGPYWKGSAHPTDELQKFHSGTREMPLCRIGSACLRKIARLSGSPKSSEPAEEKRPISNPEPAPECAKFCQITTADICNYLFRIFLTYQTEAKTPTSHRLVKHTVNQSIRTINPRRPQENWMRNDPSFSSPRGCTMQTIA